MDITNVNMKKVEIEGRVKALASITIDDSFAIHDIKVVESNGRTFVAMPSKRNANGEFKDIAHPINNETRAILEQVILDKYKEVQNGRYDRNRR